MEDGSNETLFKLLDEEVPGPSRETVNEEENGDDLLKAIVDATFIIDADGNVDF